MSRRTPHVNPTLTEIRRSSTVPRHESHHEMERPPNWKDVRELTLAWAWESGLSTARSVVLRRESTGARTLRRQADWTEQGRGGRCGGRGLEEAAIVTVVVVERRRAKGEGKGDLMPDGAQARAAGRWGANARGWRHGNGRQRKATRRRRRAATGDESGAAARAVGVPLSC